MPSLLPSESQPRIADVLIPVAVDIAYSYSVPDQLVLNEGDFVEVPLGNRMATGVVWTLRYGAGSNLKSVLVRRDMPALGKNLRDFMDWVAHWTLSARGMVLRMGTRAPEAAGPEPLRIGLRPTGHVPQGLTPARAKALALLSAPDALSLLALSKTALAKEIGCSSNILDALVDAGALEPYPLPPQIVALPPNPDFAVPVLEQSQQDAADALVAGVEARKFGVALLEGVTGSGKTEVYFEAIAAVLRRDPKGQVLILMPEIALTGQFLDRFARRFGARPAEWHSGISERRRARLWHGVASGEARVVAGARSALFLPFASLELIIVDEEHEAAYKQEEGVNYHARDMAVVRGRIEKAPVILASATPSIETRVNAQSGRYGHQILQNRFGGRTLPLLAAVDLTKTPPLRGTWIAPPLAEAVRETIARGEQALLFLNRRGYAPLTLCNACGHRFQCPQCTAWLVEHRFRRALVCHHCGHVERRPDACPQCLAEDSLTACGPGVERLAEEAAKTFEGARILVLSSDLSGGVERLRAELDSIERGGFDLVIGTQLVAKGHNFPNLTLVGVMDADVGLANGDPRAAERTFQLLQQVTGRAGRGDRPGRGLVQTYQPGHPVIRAILSGDAERFYAEETLGRQRAGLPPFGRLAALVISAPTRPLAEGHARALVRAAFSLPLSGKWKIAHAGTMAGPDEISVLGPAEAAIAVVRARHRFRLLVKAPRSADLQAFLRAMIAAAPKEAGGVRVAVDVDPQSFL